MMRRVVAAAAVALALACASGGGARRAAASAAPAQGPLRPEFAPLPPGRMSTLHRAHDGAAGAKPVCQACHAPDGALAGGATETCRRCHTFGHSNHPVDVVQKAAAPGLPLAAGGRVACHTCHEPHAIAGPRKGLRKTFNALCTTCHARH